MSNGIKIPIVPQKRPFVVNDLLGDFELSAGGIKITSP